MNKLKYEKIVCVITAVLISFLAVSKAYPSDNESKSKPKISKIHRISGYALGIGSLLNLAFGKYVLSQYKNGYRPPAYLRIPHVVLEFSVSSLAVAQAVGGTVNLISVWDERGTSGRIKRIFHGTLGYISAGLSVYNTYLLVTRNLKEHSRFLTLATIFTVATALGGIIITW